MEPTTEIIKRTKRLKIELGIYAGLFIVSFCFPAFTFFYGEDGSRIEPQYIWNSPFLFVFILAFGLVYLAILSCKKVTIHIVNIISILLTSLSAFAILMAFAWWGVSPYHPDIEIGYYLMHICIVVLIIRSYSLLPHLEEYRFSTAVSKWSEIIALSLALLIGTFITYLFL